MCYRLWIVHDACGEKDLAGRQQAPSPCTFHLSTMSPRVTERTALLENGSSPRRLSFAQRFVNVVKADGEPSWAASYKYFLFGSWLNILLVFVPLSFISHHLHWDAGLRFSFSFIAILPLAKVM